MEWPHPKKLLPLRSTQRELLIFYKRPISCAIPILEHRFSSSSSKCKKCVCPEDCSFGSQSPKQSTTSSGTICKQLIQFLKVLKPLLIAKPNGTASYLVHAPLPKEVDTICEAVIQIKQKHPQLEICSSLGMLTEEKAIRLKEAGVNRFNHNLETSEKFFPEVVSTHDFDDRVNTAKLVKKVGLDLCCGGLFGMGESMQDRVDLAFALSDLQVDSVPVNFLDPRPGTAFHGKPNPLTPNDCLRALAMMRFVMPSVEIRIAGGRETTLFNLQALRSILPTPCLQPDILPPEGKIMKQTRK